MGYLEMLNARFKKIVGDQASLRKVVEKDYKDVLLKKRSDAFFDGLYKSSYEASALVEKKFLNIGPGSFSHKYWSTADKYYDDKTWTESRRETEQPKFDYTWDIYDHKELAIKPGSVNAVYCSHVVEHAFDDDVAFLFKDVFRILKSGGVFRVACPDADLLAKSYVEKDWAFFNHYLSVRTGRREIDFSKLEQYASSGVYEEFVLDWVSLVMNDRNPVHLNRSEAIEFFKKFDCMYTAFTEASRLSDRDVNRSLGAHVNWFNYEKLLGLLTLAGFSKVRRSNYLQSSCAVMRDRYHFDRTDPEMTLYVEAVK
ncbi:class I SAM-dependent methyltransferase [Pseudovibrio sp. SPO723]|uniref:class I SAM-dependent methyltransferase n=1 Tax=Nesiotobacter zosterae TaxID=392721 RepID=UPI0029C309F0|nr:methyltransferase domain-containing protein [Pseudovibrio sp. SPO723]MDX5594264.1 methyltransferase domain-containing protein [Pseudovibrio sp. SPO723]